MVYEKDYYTILGISPDASKEEIRRAYRHLVLQCHPDKNPEIPSGRFNEVTEAYKILSNDQKKSKYDYTLRMSEAFKGTPETTSDRSRSRIGPDLKISINVELEDLIRQNKKTVVIKRKGACKECAGTGSKNKKRSKCLTCSGKGVVPDLMSIIFGGNKCPHCGGIGSYPDRECKACCGTGQAEESFRKTIQLTPHTKNCIVLQKLGNYPVGGGTPGNLIVGLNIKEHPVYSLRSLNIWGNLEISPAQAILGDSMEIDVFGKKEVVVIPINVKDKMIIKKEGAGISYGDRKGDLILRFNMRLPSEVSSEEIELYRKILDIEGGKRKHG